MKTDQRTLAQQLRDMDEAWAEPGSAASEVLHNAADALEWVETTMTPEEARAALQPILDYLRAEEAKHAPTRAEEDWTEYAGDGVPHWDLARDLADELLTAANRDGHNGCPLCRS